MLNNYLSDDHTESNDQVEFDAIHKTNIMILRVFIYLIQMSCSNHRVIHH